jgi:cytidine deaminase
VGSSLTEKRVSALREAALDARKACYPRYSGFEVLAAVERIDGRVYGGANVEIVNYSLTKHAEEAAALAAIADGALALGDKWLAAVYVRGASPCGGCRQFLWEWAHPDALCVVDGMTGDPPGATREYRLQELYPEPFDPVALANERNPRAH